MNELYGKPLYYILDYLAVEGYEHEVNEMRKSKSAIPL